MSRVPWFPSSHRRTSAPVKLRNRPAPATREERMAMLGLWLGLAGLALVTSGSVFSVLGFR